MKDFDLESELKSSVKIVTKCCDSDDYSRDLYSALCNMQWQKKDIWPILKDEFWSCTWRYAGGIVAEIRNEGDYLNWYCQGNEGYVSDEIKTDLDELGWVPVPYSDDMLI